MVAGSGGRGATETATASEREEPGLTRASAGATLRGRGVEAGGGGGGPCRWCAGGAGGGPPWPNVRAGMSDGGERQSSDTRCARRCSASARLCPGRAPPARRYRTPCPDTRTLSLSLCIPPCSRHPRQPSTGHLFLPLPASSRPLFISQGSLSCAFPTDAMPLYELVCIAKHHTSLVRSSPSHPRPDCSRAHPLSFLSPHSRPRSTSSSAPARPSLHKTAASSAPSTTGGPATSPIACASARGAEEAAEAATMAPRARPSASASPKPLLSWSPQDRARLAAH